MHAAGFGSYSQSVLNRDEKLPAVRLAFIQYAIAVILAVLVFGLWRLQVVGGQNYHALAEANRIRKVPILAPRGKLFDREGRLLVDNYPSVSCFLIREQGHDITPDLPLISRGLHMTADQIDAIIKRYRTAPKYQPLPLKQDITPDEVEFIEAHKDELPELETIQEQRRLYPRDGFAAHLIGYVGEVSEDMLNDPRYAMYEPGDVVGRSGVEASYDSILRGEDGSQDVVVDSHGREVGKIGTEPAKPGQSLRLTIDLDIQRAAENALGDRNGAMIAIDPHTGEVLALVSRPVFDPNAFSVRISRDTWNKYLTDPEHPLMDKAIQAQLAPGSTFKIIMATAGLEEGIAQDMRVVCTGGVSLFGTYQRCWVSAHHGSHGVVDINHSIPWSCDVFYYTLAARLGIEKIAYWASRFGIGRKTGIDLPDETSGTMPSPEWKMRNYHQKWYPGEVTSVGIGQGAVAVTPIQLIRAIAGITSGGVFKRPHVVFPDEIKPPDVEQSILDSYPGSGNQTVPISAATWETVTDAMAAVTEPGGTAGLSHLEGIDFAGKTGSAQTMSNALAAKLGHSHTVNDNAWFVGVSPRRNPDIAVVVLWEGGKEGYFSARLAARVIAAYVDKQRQKDHNLIAQQPQKIEVGALWSNPAAPDSLGGKPLPARPGQKTDPELASIRGGHFTVPVQPQH
ncbi:MAG: penicillin-binding protein 2 [Acidobacteriaceae bacterium]